MLFFNNSIMLLVPLLFHMQDFAEIIYYYDSFIPPPMSLGHNMLKEAPDPFSKK